MRAVRSSSWVGGSVIARANSPPIRSRSASGAPPSGAMNAFENRQRVDRHRIKGSRLGDRGEHSLLLRRRHRYRAYCSRRNRAPLLRNRTVGRHPLPASEGPASSVSPSRSQRSPAADRLSLARMRATGAWRGLVAIFSGRLRLQLVRTSAKVRTHPHSPRRASVPTLDVTRVMRGIVRRGLP